MHNTEERMKESEFHDKISMDDIAGTKKHVVEEWFLPVARLLLKEYPTIHCVVVSLAQYWNDEANDAVHVSFIPSSVPFEFWEELFSSKNKFYSEDSENFSLPKSDGSTGYVSFYSLSRRAIGFNPQLSNDETFISIFERYCKEGCGQDMRTQESYQPYLIVSRNGDDIKVRDLGDLVRIWS